MLEQHTEFYHTVKAKKDFAADTLADLQDRLSKANVLANDLESARDIAQSVLLLTQERVKTTLEEIVTLALSTVYPDHAFELVYEIKRGQSEATPYIVIDGVQRSPREELGGGVLDVASLGMRLALWALTEPKPANFFILDEPAKFLSADKQVLFSEMIKKVSDTLGIQVLLISHNNAIIDMADKVYLISQKDGISTATPYNEL